VVPEWTARYRDVDALGVTVLSLAMVSGFVAIRCLTHGDELGSFVVAGSAFVHEAIPGVPVHAQSTGYDGQFYYRLALDPLTRLKTAYGITLDDPSYRQQRIGLPALSWLLHVIGISVTTALVLVNALSVILVGWLGARWAIDLGRSALWGLAIAASPALVIALARDLTEPLATAGLLAGLLLWSRCHRFMAACAFTMAALSRETVCAVLAGMALYWLWKAARDRSTSGAMGTSLAAVGWLGVPFAVELAWQLYLRSVWGGALPAFAGGHPGLPVLQAVESFFSGASGVGLSHQGLLDLIWIVERVALVAFLVVVATGLKRSAVAVDIRVGWVAAVIVSLSTPWHTDGFLRAANEAIVLGQLLLVGRRDRLATRTLAGTAAGSILMAAMYAVAL
jgi:hypothetical protein